jgi:hypothetical protein
VAGEARPKQVHPGKRSRIWRKKEVRNGPPPSWGKDFLVFLSPSRRGGIAKTEKEEKEYKKKIEKE